MSSKRKNSRPVKAEPQHETSSNPKFSVEVKKEIIKSQKRFLFNIEQIEAKYCGSSSGLVLAADNDKVN